MLKVALTGGIATGKTHVAALLRAAGVPIIDADVVAREVVAPGTPALAAIVARFGRDVLTPDGALDRAALGNIVFRDDAARGDLEAIIHPLVRAAVEEFFDGLSTATPFGVADIPLLYETGRETSFDRVVVVACSPEAQIDRVMARDGLTREDAERRIAAQWPIAEKVKRAGDVVSTDGSYAETATQVAALIARLRELSA